MTIIIHSFKWFLVTDNILCLWFFTIIKWDLLIELNKGVKMYKDLKKDKKILEDLLSNIQGNGYKESSYTRKS